MPTRRRATPSNAAALPASRLPLGTPYLAPERSPPPPPSRTISRNSQDSLRGLDKENELGEETPHLAALLPPVRLTALIPGAGIVADMSLAEAKLARQNKRIQQAEAALTAAGNAERQVSRGKGKIWKPFDFNADAAPANTSIDGRAPMAEIRINTFRAPTTRDSSMSRSMSSLSQRTTGTMQSDAERQDSAVIDAGFQVFTTRKHRRNVEELSAYEDKPEEKQTTVEATIDPRDIYNVFGNALPGPEFIEQNLGYKEGQLQFVQHPNGDVSAHQWSASRYIWENIGQFSNIRKKVEGQLAADRLKGQTAHQTLQQHTLAYFRTVAKQREAVVMGLIFGVKEIQALMPDLRPAQPAPTPKKAVTAAEIASPSPAVITNPNPTITYDDNASSTEDSRSQFIQDQPYSYEAYPSYTGYYGAYAGPQYQYGYQYHVPTGPHGERYQSQDLLHPALIDPFLSAGSGRNSYGRGAALEVARYNSYGQQAQQGGASDIQHGLGYDYHFPGPAIDIQQSQPANVTTDSQERMDDYSQIDAARGLADYYMRKNGTQFSNTESGQPGPDVSPRHVGSEETATPAPRLKLVTPLSSRVAMRDSLIKLTNQATERSLSQGNIRTVLYDPFRSQSSTEHDEVTEPVKPAPTVSPEIKRTVANPSGLPAHMQPASAQKMASGKPFCPAVGSHRMSSIGNNIENTKKLSIPDKYRCKQESESNAPVEQGPPTPQNLNESSFGDYPWQPSSASKDEPYVPSTRNHDQELKHWWFNGDTFARQEAFYQRINTNPNSSLTSPPAARTSFSTPTAKATFAPTTSPISNDPMTRLLIPVLENLSAYVQGPLEKRRDYFCQWSQPPEWAVDRSPSGNNSFFDKDWGQPPARVGRDPRYRTMPPAGMESVRFGAFGSPQAESRLGLGGGLDRRFAAFG
ncbi:hypothetical protein LTR08_007680 [Meristemomyces frigidus]|nr:hypothetical protein LTR08_007680 [Meristemomyces frigidus]